MTIRELRNEFQKTVKQAERMTGKNSNLVNYYKTEWATLETLYAEGAVNRRTDYISDDMLALATGYDPQKTDDGFTVVRCLDLAYIYATKKHVRNMMMIFLGLEKQAAEQQAEEQAADNQTTEQAENTEKQQTEEPEQAAAETAPEEQEAATPTPTESKGESTMKEATTNAAVQATEEPTAFEQKFFDRADRKEARATKTSAQATAKAEAGWAMLDVIPMGQPIHGAKDRRYRDKAGAKIDSGYAMMQKADYQERKAEASREYAEKVQSGAIARSDDPEAIAKLEKRIAELTKAHEESKKAVREHNAEFDRMLKSGELEAVVLDPWGQPLKDDASEWAKKHAYTVYYKDGKRIYKATVEKSTTAEIRRLKKRIEEIRKTAEICADSDGWEFDGGRIELNAEAGRIQAYFYEIPTAEVRTELKRDGWKWARTAGAWQKMLNERNIRHAKQNEILKPIEQAEPEQVQEIHPEEMPEESAQPETIPTEADVQPTDAPEDMQAVNNAPEPEKSEEQTAPTSEPEEQLAVAETKATQVAEPGNTYEHAVEMAKYAVKCGDGIQAIYRKGNEYKAGLLSDKEYAGRFGWEYCHTVNEDEPTPKRVFLGGYWRILVIFFPANGGYDYADRCEIRAIREHAGQEDYDDIANKAIRKDERFMEWELYDAETTSKRLKHYQEVAMKKFVEKTGIQV